MSGTYKIDPQGVQTVLTTVGDRASELATALDDVDSATQDVLAGSGNDGIVAQALSGFLTDQKAGLENVGTRISAGLNGATLATLAYVQGDEQMEASTSTAMTTAFTSDDLTPLATATISSTGHVEVPAATEGN
jgi:hypothetical protein